MKPMTEKNLLDAFAGESQAHMKYLIYAEKAEREHLPNIAKMFRAIAYAEFVHASNHFKALKKLNNTKENLGDAYHGETFEIEEMYPAYKEVAQLQGEKSAVRTIDWALQAEKTHAEMYKEAKARAEKGEDEEVQTIWVCEVCGYTEVGDSVPDVCPVCGAKPEAFQKF